MCAAKRSRYKGAVNRQFLILTGILSALTFGGVWVLMEPSRPWDGVWYPDCNAAWAAGAAPIQRGEPGYRRKLDADHDGVACEPYAG